MKVPTDYTIGYEKARAIAPDIADRYIAHTLIGDPLGEEMAADLEAFSASESERLIQAAMNEEGEEALRDARTPCEDFSKRRNPRRSGSTILHSPRVSACFTETRR